MMTSLMIYVQVLIDFLYFLTDLNIFMTMKKLVLKFI